MPGLLPVPTTPAEFSPAPITDEPAATVSRAALDLIGTIGNIDLVPPARRVGGPGASHLMAPFTHVSTRPPKPLQPGTIRRPLCRTEFQTALLETAHHHARFMAKTNEPASWTSQFREILPQTAGSHPVTVLLANPDTSLRAALYRESGLVQ